MLCAVDFNDRSFLIVVRYILVNHPELGWLAGQTLDLTWG
jgi:hypothetical protein